MRRLFFVCLPRQNKPCLIFNRLNVFGGDAAEIDFDDAGFLADKWRNESGEDFFGAAAGAVDVLAA